MMRGDLAIASASGDLGKPRPVLIIQSDSFSETSTVTMLLLTSDIHDIPLLRMTVEPSAENGLRQRSQVMIDKVTTLRREKVSDPIGRLSAAEMRAVDQLLALFMGFG